MTVYVERNLEGAIVGVYALQQDPPLEAIDDADPEVVAYVNPSAAVILARHKASAKVSFETPPTRVLRAIVLVALDEINALRARIRAQDAAVAAAGSLAALKTNWAALAPVPDRTATQARNAVLARIDTADAD